MMRPPVKFHWRGNHHLYYGFFFMAFGAFNVFMGSGNGPLEALQPLWASCLGLGGLMVLDDVIEHTITADTPMRMLYRFLFKVKE